MKQPSEYSPLYIQGDITDPIGVLERYYSKSHLRRKLKEGAVKVGKPHGQEVWIKMGKVLIVVSEYNPDEPGPKSANGAQIWWEYHYQLMPKTIVWETLNEEVCARRESNPQSSL